MARAISTRTTKRPEAGDRTAAGEQDGGAKTAPAGAAEAATRPGAGRARPAKPGTAAQKHEKKAVSGADPRKGRRPLEPGPPAAADAGPGGLPPSDAPAPADASD